MIQFRWRRAETISHSEGHGTGMSTIVIKPVEAGAVKVNGEWCVLQYRVNFIPTATQVREQLHGDIETIITLKEPRPVDAEWKTVTPPTD